MIRWECLLIVFTCIDPYHYIMPMGTKGNKGIEQVKDGNSCGSFLYLTGSRRSAACTTVRSTSLPYGPSGPCHWVNHSCLTGTLVLHQYYSCWHAHPMIAYSLTHFNFGRRMKWYNQHLQRWLQLPWPCTEWPSAVHKAPMKNDMWLCKM